MAAWDGPWRVRGLGGRDHFRQPQSKCLLSKFVTHNAHGRHPLWKKGDADLPTAAQLPANTTVPMHTCVVFMNGGAWRMGGGAGGDGRPLRTEGGRPEGGDAALGGLPGPPPVNSTPSRTTANTEIGGTVAGRA